jgi:hypothetical protein
MTIGKLAWIVLGLVLLASVISLPARLVFIRPTLPIIRLWSDPEEQNRRQFPEVPHDLLRAAEAALPPDAKVLLITAGKDVRRRDYITFHRALYLLAPRPVWWLAPAPPDGTWESRWWTSAPLTPEQVHAVVAEKQTDYALVCDAPDLTLPGRKMVEMKEGYLLQLQAEAALPIGQSARATYAGKLWPLQIALAVMVIMLVGWMVVPLATQLGYRIVGVEAAALAWALGAGLVSVICLWLNAFGVRLHGQMMALSLIGVVGLIARWRWREKGRQPAGSLSRPQVSVARALLLLLLAAQTILVTCMAIGHPLHIWDSWVNWGMKARAIFLEGYLSPAIYTDASRAVTLLGYPLLVPLIEAWFYAWLGAPDDRFAGMLAIMCYLALAGVGYAAVRRWGGSWTMALLTAVTITSIPYIARLTEMVMAEVPLIVMAAVAALYLLEWYERGTKGALLLAALGAAFMPWTKQEGWVLLAALCAALLITGKGRRRALVGVAICIAGAVLIAGPWYVLIAVKGIDNPAFLPLTWTTLQANVNRLAFIVWAELRSLVSLNWGFLWPLATVFGWQTWRSGWQVINLLPVAALIYLGLMTLTYLFSDYAPYQQHVISSVDRVIAPVAIFPLLWIAYHGSRG